MKNFVANIESISKENSNFRTVLYTSTYAQIVVMSLKPGEEIGQEIHETTDQFIRVEQGKGNLIIGTEHYEVSDGFATLIPAGIMHNLTNTSSDTDLKLYTIYTPPHHKDGTIHQTRADALKDTSDHI